MSERMTYSVDEAARLLGVGRTSMYALVHRGEISYLRVGRRIVIPRDALSRLLGLDVARS